MEKKVEFITDEEIGIIILEDGLEISRIENPEMAKAIHGYLDKHPDMTGADLFAEALKMFLGYEGVPGYEEYAARVKALKKGA